jgi:acyl-CoA reductase-like NAD-dependent aldehyde dehydrogenase
MYKGNRKSEDVHGIHVVLNSPRVKQRYDHALALANAKFGTRISYRQMCCAISRGILEDSNNEDFIDGVQHQVRNLAGKRNIGAAFWWDAVSVPQLKSNEYAQFWNTINTHVERLWRTSVGGTPIGTAKGTHIDTTV